MGRAILGGLIKSGAASSQEVVVSDASEANRLDAEEKFGVRTFSENAACAKEADLVVFAVKPGVLPLAAADVRDVLREEQTVLSIAAGKSLSDLDKRQTPPPLSQFRTDRERLRRSSGTSDGRDASLWRYSRREADDR